MPEKIHIIGAGLAGLAAALRLADGSRRIALYEAAPQAGGRCRSYFDATLEMVIDNGNHLLLSGNRAALTFLREVESEDQLVGPASAEYPFIDLASGQSWVLRPNDAAIPWWILSPKRRVPGTRARDYLGVLGLLRAAKGTPIREAMPCDGLLYQRLWRPFFLAALNTAPEEGAASLAATILRETLAKGGRACRPLVAAKGLSNAFVNPALRRLEARKAEVSFERRLSAIELADDRVNGLDFGGDRIEVAAGERVILAVPAPVAASLLPGLQDPAGLSRDRERPFQDRPSGRSAVDPRRGQRHDRMAVRLSGSIVGDDQRRRPPDRCAARGTRSKNLGGCDTSDTDCGADARMANHQGEAGDLCRDSRRRGTPTAGSDGL